MLPASFYFSASPVRRRQCQKLIVPSSSSPPPPPPQQPGSSSKAAHACRASTCSLSRPLHEGRPKAHSCANGLQTSCRRAASARVSTPSTLQHAPLTRSSCLHTICTIDFSFSRSAWHPAANRQLAHQSLHYRARRLNGLFSR